jgi:hypothetical protein
MKDWNDAYKAGVDIRAFANDQWAKEREQAKPKTNGTHNGTAPAPKASVPSFTEWMGREIPATDLLLGSFLSTTARILISGPTGLGKTMLGLAIAIAVEAGAPLLHWKAGRPARVLYIDGEMPRRLMIHRLREEAGRAGREPNNLFILSREDFEDMPPLNTQLGQRWMDAKIEGTKPELIIFDNIQALIVGDHCKEESWAPMLPWVRSLTRRHIGQSWFHHTGHNEGHSYGTSTRQWQMDTCILLERVSDTDDLTFTIKFTKARERAPDNREDFADTTVRLRNDTWEITKGGPKKKKVPESATIAFNLLEKAINEAGELPPVGDHAPAGVRGVKVDTWGSYCRTGTITRGEGKDAFRKAFERAGSKLQALGLIQVWADWVWIS